METKPSFEKQCFSWMLAMGVVSVGCTFFNRSFPTLPWYEDTPSIKAAAIFGSIWGATIHGMNSLSSPERLTGRRRVEILYVSALLPTFLLYPPDKSIFSILSPYIPLAALGTAYRILWATRYGHNIL